MLWIGNFLFLKHSKSLIQFFPRVSRESQKSSRFQVLSTSILQTYAQLCPVPDQLSWELEPVLVRIERKLQRALLSQVHFLKSLWMVHGEFFSISSVDMI